MQKIAKQFNYIISLQLILTCEDKKAQTLNKNYIAYQGTEKVGVLNGETGEIIREVDVNISGMGDNPHYIVIDEVNNFWYVTLLESGYVLKNDLINKNARKNAPQKTKHKKKKPMSKVSEKKNEKTWNCRSCT